MKKRRPRHISKKDWDAVDVPALPDRELKKMRRALDVLPSAFFKGMEEQKRKMGRPRLEAPKKLLTMRLSPDIVDGIKSSGPGYNGRVERVLADALDRGML